MSYSSSSWSSTSNYGDDSISSTQPRYGSESNEDDSAEEIAEAGESNERDDGDGEMNTHAVIKRDNKKFLNNFNGAVAMHRGSCKEGSQIQTPWIGKDGKKISLGSCTKKSARGFTGYGSFSVSKIQHVCSCWFGWDYGAQIRSRRCSRRSY